MIANFTYFLAALYLPLLLKSRSSRCTQVRFITNRSEPYDSWSYDGTRQNKDEQTVDNDLAWFETLSPDAQIAFIVGMAVLGLMAVLCGCGVLCGFLFTEVCNKKDRNNNSQPQLVVLSNAAGTANVLQAGHPTGQSDIVMLESGPHRYAVSPSAPLPSPPPQYITFHG